jgi:hypothetical protein
MTKELISVIVEECNSIIVKIVIMIPHYRNNSKIDTPNTYIHDHSISLLGTGTSIKSGGVEIVICAQLTEYFSNKVLISSEKPFER